MHHQQTVALHEASLIQSQNGNSQIKVHFYANQDHVFSRHDELVDMYKKSFRFFSQCLMSKRKT